MQRLSFVMAVMAIMAVIWAFDVKTVGISSLVEGEWMGVLDI